MTTLQRWTLAAVCAATAVLMLDIAVVNTALPTLAVDLGTGFEGLKWVVDAYALALASVVLTAGALADRLGRRRLFAAGLVLFTVSSVGCAAAGSIEVLSAARAVQGVGAAVMFAVSLALLANAFPSARERAGALAAYGATIGAAFAVGPAVGGVLTTALGWRWVFLVNVPIGLAVLAVTARHLRESRDPHPRRLDVPGQLTLIGGLFLLVFGLLRVAEDGWTAPVIGALGGAAVLLAAFLAVEARSPAPMVPLGLFRDPRFAGAQVTAFAISAGLFAVFVYVMVYLQGVLGLSAVEAGLVLVPGTVLNLVVAGATAGLSDKVHPGTMMTGGLALVAVGLGWLTTVSGVDATWLTLQPGICVAMIGTGLFNPAVSAVALDVPERQSGLAAGFYETARQAGIAVGVAALGTLVPQGVGAGAAGAQAFVDGLQDALVAGAVLAALGALAAAVLVRERAVRPRLAVEAA